MKFVDEYRDSGLVRDLAVCIRRDAKQPMTFMEVCGTHTMAIARAGIRTMMPAGVRLISGPGCPVCVTPQAEIDRVLSLSQERNVIVASFGDMLRVPGTASSLERERARGADVRVVYSPLDAIALAVTNPRHRVVFCGVGFETTIPAVALAVLDAEERGLENFFVHCAHKTMPQALLALAGDPGLAIDGFLCPGHVSVITGTSIYEPIASACHLPCVIAGFEPLDILQAVLLLARQVAAGRAAVEIQYTRAVSREGNRAARACAERVFGPADAEWRGLGVIPGSGLRFREEYAAFDAAQFLPAMMPAAEPLTEHCACGEILTGRKSPQDCPLFGTACTPAAPVGACMVSSEGACAAAFRYAP